MKGVLVDSNVILDLFTNDPKWVNWSESILEEYSASTTLFINPIIYSEISINFNRMEELDWAVYQGGFEIVEIPKKALFLAGKTFRDYKKNKGTKNSTLPDFFIGAHALVQDLTLITRDEKRYRTYFPELQVVSPASQKT